MTTTPPEAPGPDTEAQAPEDVRTVPSTTKGSGQYAVWDHDLGQFVSGVSDKATTDKARKALSGHNGAITDGHKLETLEV
jgi:hypothetical protein